MKQFHLCFKEEESSKQIWLDFNTPRLKSVSSCYQVPCLQALHIANNVAKTSRRYYVDPPTLLREHESSSIRVKPQRRDSKSIGCVPYLSQESVYPSVQSTCSNAISVGFSSLFKRKGSTATSSASSTASSTKDYTREDSKKKHDYGFAEAAATHLSLK